VAGLTYRSCADDFIQAPQPWPFQTGTIFPFLIKETTAYTTNIPTMRYQQVYNSSLFTSASSASIYVSTLAFGSKDPPQALDWVVPSMQINLSTTSNTADHLSLVFAENVGSDDTVVLDRTSHIFLANDQSILLKRPFRFNPPLGNLLLDVRIFDGSGQPFPPSDPAPQMAAYTSPTDACSRVWSTNVVAPTATGSDSISLWTLIELSPVPSLLAYTSYFGTTTNWVAIEWPTQPTTFVLQRSASIAANAQWQTVSNAGVFSNASFQRYYFPAASAGAGSFYRLVWPSGQALTRITAAPEAAISNIDESIR
jgi:hypothetical protein